MIQAGHVKIYCIFQLLKISAIILRFLSIEKVEEVGKIERSLPNSCNLQLCLLVGCSNIYIYRERDYPVSPSIPKLYAYWIQVSNSIKVLRYETFPFYHFYLYLREFAKKKTPFAHAEHMPQLPAVPLAETHAKEPWVKSFVWDFPRWPWLLNLWWSGNHWITKPAECFMIPKSIHQTYLEITFWNNIFGQQKAPLTLPETNSSPLKIGLPNRKVVFQPSIFRCYVSFSQGIVRCTPTNVPLREIPI